MLIDHLIYSEDGKAILSTDKEYWNIKSVTIPEGVTHIRRFAFRDCIYLRDISFPKSLEVIEDYAFYHCKKIKKICLYDNIKIIGEKCFSNCTKLEGVYISGSIRIIQKDAFSGCQKLKHIYLMCNNPASLKISPNWFHPERNVLFTLHIPLGTFTAYKRLEAFREFNMDIDSKFDSNIFNAIFPQYTTLNDFITILNAKSRWPECISDKLEIKPDIELNGEKLMLKTKINQIESSEEFKIIISKRFYSKIEILKKWTPTEINIFLPSGERIGNNQYYKISKIEQIEKENSFLRFRTEPINWIISAIQDHFEILDLIDPTFFVIPVIPQETLVNRTFEEYKKRNLNSLSLEDFIDDECFCNSQIRAYLRHNCTKYNKLMTALNIYAKENAEIYRDILHEKIDQAIFLVYPWLERHDY